MPGGNQWVRGKAVGSKGLQYLVFSGETLSGLKIEKVTLEDVHPASTPFTPAASHFEGGQRFPFKAQDGKDKTSPRSMHADQLHLVTQVLLNIPLQRVKANSQCS
jgi:hypothetical protein